ncbi:MAG TPA: hypothetical protein VMS73_07075 [Anaerolineaceae bacterium]|nr:hypothetical protein [Anaerolineaceae bacterium]
MAQPVYKVWMMKYKDAFYKLSKDEQDKLGTAVDAALKQVGGERLMTQMCVWSTEKWLAWGVEKFPSIEAVQQYAMLLFNLNHFEYIESDSFLGVEMPPM